MAYNTGNPIGSTSPKDLSDNARNLDYFVNGQEASYPDRKGVPRKSWKGMEAEHNVDQVRRESEFDAAQVHRTEVFDATQGNREDQFNTWLDGSGFENDPLVYVDGSPLRVDRVTQLVDRGGSLYTVKRPASFPYGLTGEWATDATHLVLRNDQSIRQDLAEPTGAGRVGWTRRPTLAAESSVDYILSLQPINIWENEFTSLITEKPDAHAPQTWDWAPAIQAANDLIRTRFNTYGPGIQNVIQFPGSIYKVKSKITLSAFVKIKSVGMVVFQTEVANDSAFHFTAATGDYSSNTAVINKQQWMRGPFINGADGGFTFHNMLGRAGCIGLEIGSRTDLGELSPTARYTSCEYNIEGYAIAIKFNRFRNYIATFEKVHLELNDELVVFGEPSMANVLDSGENIHFIGCTFANCTTAFRWYCDGFDVNLTNCSYDYIGTVFRLHRLYKKITVHGGHMEGIGGVRAHDGVGGILLEESASSADTGTQCLVQFIGVSAVTPPGNVFRGSSKVQLELDYEYRKIGTDNTPAKLFLVDPRITLRRKAIVNQHRATLPSWAVNHQRNPTFTLDAEGSTAAPTGYTRVAGGAPSVIEAASASVLGGKAIKITGAASGSYYILDANDKTPCAPGDVVLANLFAKFPADVTAAQCSITCRLQFFSSADEVLLTTSEVSNDYGNSELIMGEWSAHVWARQAVAPAGTAYYKARFGVTGIGMNSRITYITGLYSTILK
ncbi:hypothetical protein [Pseudomonas vancouverensis]|uniref:Tail spike TSP1/Gp66 N-terminal domain-containing protein n=1 Tax=Pseudomonas vancouverensis TaxID=95300 RepID=A0A4R4KLM5_PSEVA|nr:hypothetical protein [Pseudomonas vancouverensis]KAB0489634.1 hypothetical protein F7R09_28335 [Pseudomonas vancouverensis]TDB69280.1 hypothetical protein EIY72_00040 [Pseudomonas vancouverensis]